jgi:hypothetical protein
MIMLSNRISKLLLVNGTINDLYFERVLLRISIEVTLKSTMLKLCPKIPFIDLLIYLFVNVFV